MTGIIGAMMTGIGSNALHIATTSASIQSGTSLVVNTPTHASGDRIYIFIGSDSNSGIQPITNSQGFSQRATRTGNDTAVWSKVAGASEPSSYTFTISANDNEVVIYAISVRGITSDAIGTISATNVAGSVTMIAAGLLWCFSNKRGALSITSGPAGMATVSELSYFGNMAGLYKQDVNSGATGDKTTTFSGGTTANSVLIGVW